MILRLLGAALAFLAVSGGGFYLAGAGHFRVKELSGLRSSLIILKSEIDFGLSALEAAALACVHRGDGAAARFFTKVSENLCAEGLTADAAWQAALFALKPIADDEDEAAIGLIGKSLGMLDKDAQIASIDMAIAYLDEKTALLCAKAAKDGKMYQSVGIIGGLMAAIVLF